jgi:hypothetical protein
VLKSRCEQGLRISISALEDRIADYEAFVRWPALIESLNKDLEILKAAYFNRYQKQYVKSFNPR